ncbi:MAG: sulfate ABC transporter permease [Pyrobaculum sp.]|uniref:sulfate ABC transporter permease n=1 Tax=Pyrobaculum sp. 3827-6 TaxID=2983604 RepID=UPI0021D93893|nr:sulfate ABC transporter permease [Pyrobaculum sp. 3827-6]MCU7788632.1 sulfate ABC transporter permease [Pyrobaculum sp. 3827-6]
MLALLVILFMILLLIVLPLAHAGELAPGLGESLVLTALFSVAASALALLPGLAVAMWGRAPGRGLAAQILYVPAVVPPTAVGVLLLGSVTAPGKICGWLGVDCRYVSEALYGLFVNKPAGIVLAMFVMALPVVYAVFDGALREVRAEAYFRSLGFGGLKLLWLVLLSLRRAAASAFIFSFLRGFGELGVLLIFAAYPPTLPIYIYNSWLIYGVGPAVTASLLTMAIGVVSAYVIRLWLSR